MAHSTDIVGYTYRADQYCPDCMRAIAINMFRPTDRQFVEHDATEIVLGLVAKALDIDHENESSYDSGVFPKVIFRDQTHDLYVSGCGQDEHGCNSRCGQCGAILGGYDTCPALEDQ